MTNNSTHHIQSCSQRCDNCVDHSRTFIQVTLNQYLVDVNWIYRSTKGYQNLIYNFIWILMLRELHQNW